MPTITFYLYAKRTKSVFATLTLCFAQRKARDTGVTKNIVLT